MFGVALFGAALLGSALLGGCVRFQSVATGHAAPPPRGGGISSTEELRLPGRGRMRVIDRNPGADKTVLLVHGYGSSSASYRPVLADLAASYRVLLVDLPGFGASDRLAGDYSPDALADVLAEVLDQKGVKRAYVVGHSWGGSIALAFALRHPDRLVRLGVISGWVFDDQLIPLMRWSRLPGLGELLYGVFYKQALGERLYFNFHDPSLVTESTVDDVKQMANREGSVAVALAAARGMSRLAENERSYARITAPTLLVWGHDDRVSRPAFGERLARLLPHARLVELPSCGHIPMWECPSGTLGALKDFLDAEEAVR